MVSKFYCGNTSPLMGVLRFRFPFPDIPPGWTPDPRRVWDADKNKENVDATQRRDQPQSHAEWKKNKLSADQVRA